MSAASIRRAASALFRRFIALAALVALSPLSLAADRIELKDGSVIFGTLKDADGGKVVLATAFAGDIEIDQSQIRAMDVDSELVLQLEDGSVLEAPGLRVDGERLLLEEEAARAYALAELTRINPEPWELGNGYNFTGLASFAFNSQRGNSDLDELDYRLEMRWQSLDDRIRFEGFGEIDEAQGVKNAENWTTRLRYDRVQKGDWYWGGGLTLEQDLFADLDLRTTVGPYFGRKFLTDPIFELEAETGLAYISEDFVSGADDRDYVGSTWDLHINSNYLGGDSRLYLDHRGVWNLDEAANVVLNTTVGLAIPLFYGIEGAAEVSWNINTGAVEGTEQVDQAYRLRLGYSW
ncbi:MAG: DUF481 domain-containing protein [Halieaceae bacterium]|jgi:putative salt-induced outer membrane protein YdiY|nr:DUF481 domain-containing protein [Halieaceae bacterium]